MPDSRLAEAKEMALQIKERTSEHKHSLVSAGVAFYAFLSVFPALATVVSVYGLISDTESVQQNISRLSGMLPPEVLDILTRRLQDIASEQSGSLTMGLIFGILLSLWSANKAMKAAAQALNVAYDEDEDRGFVKINIVTLALTLISSVVAILAISVVVAIPVVVSNFLSREPAQIITVLMSWGTLIAILAALFSLLYRYAPARSFRPGFLQSLPGSLFATILFIVSSIAFSFYVSNFGSYDKQYGAIGAVVVSMLWLYLGSYIFLLGAEINASRRQKHVSMA